MIDSIGGRKVVMALVVATIGVAVVFFKGDIPANLLALLQVVFGAFVVGNGVEHYTSARASAAASEGEPDPINAPDYVDVGHLLQAVDDIKAQNAAIQEQNAKLYDSVELSQQGLSRILEIAMTARTNAPKP